MKENNFFDNINGTFYRYITNRGETGFTRNVTTIPGLVSLNLVENLKPIAVLTTLAGYYGAVVSVLTDGKSVIGSSFTVDNLNVKSVLSDGRLVTYVESPAFSGKKYLDLTDINDCRFVIDTLIKIYSPVAV